LKEQSRYGNQPAARPTQRRAPFNFQQEKPNILAAVGEATQACNGLVNALQRVNRESESVTTNLAVQEYLLTVKDTRKKVVRYTQLIEDDPSGDFIGTLLSTNEQIFAALSLYDRWSVPAEQDSDDEAMDAATVAAATNNRQPVPSDMAAKLAKMNLDHETEIMKLQDRQKAEVERLNKNRATTPSVDSDLLDWISLDQLLQQAVPTYLIQCSLNMLLLKIDLAILFPSIPITAAQTKKITIGLHLQLMPRTVAATRNSSRSRRRRIWARGVCCKIRTMTIRLPIPTACRTVH